MSLLAGDPPIRLAFSMAENKGVFALLLGSGLSRSAGIPTGWEITLDLVRRIAAATGVSDQEDWASGTSKKLALNPTTQTYREAGRHPADLLRGRRLSA